MTAADRQTPAVRTTIDGKFVAVDKKRFLIKGVTYGTFAPDAKGYQFPTVDVIARDFAGMQAVGINTVRTYTTPGPALLDEAARHGLRVMVGIPWSQHVAFLDDASLCRQIRHDVVTGVRELAGHPAALLFALGNEVPAPVVRWHGPTRVEQFLRELYEAAKTAAPDALLTYVNYPPTEYLSLPFLDICAFNVYLHREPDLRRYLARLQHLAGNRPLLLAEAGTDSQREGEEGQAAITSMQLRSTFSEGACGAIAFAWTDEWWRGGTPIDDWSFGLVDAERRPKTALLAVSDVLNAAPFSVVEQQSWPKVSVVVCAYNEAGTIDECLTSLDGLTYPDFEIILINDGSRDATSVIARQHPAVKVIDIDNGGLSAARNIGLEQATGEIVAYTDGDVRVDPDWLTFLVQPFITSDVVGAGGPNVVPNDDPPMAQCIARAPGSPAQVLIDDRIAEHVPGCNMAFRRDALLAVGGFNPIYLRAGDDVDICWRLQARGWKIGFAPAALVWHRHRSTLRAYWKQQVGYGEGESWLKPHHPDQFQGLHIGWRGQIYGPLPFHRALSRQRINSGTWGTAPFPSVYNTGTYPFAFIPHSARWEFASVLLIVLGALTLTTPQLGLAAALLAAGLCALGTTMTRCARYARATDIAGLPIIGQRSLRLSRAIYRTRIAGLYFVQPLARAWGNICGALAPPQVDQRKTLHASAPDLKLATMRRAWPRLSLRSTERRFWSENWMSGESLLTELTDRLQQSRDVRTVEIDDGWRGDRDISISLGRWAWLDLRALVEEHESDRCLIRISQRIRQTVMAALVGIGLTGGLIIGVTTGTVQHSPLFSYGVVALLVAVAGQTAWRSARVIMAVDAAIEETRVAVGLLLIQDRSAPASEETDQPETTTTALDSLPASSMNLNQTEDSEETRTHPQPQVGDILVQSPDKLLPAVRLPTVTSLTMPTGDLASRSPERHTGPHSRQDSKRA
jgi:GT2 family glycosyltransferase